MLLDTHLHLVYLDRLTYPWLDDVPALKQQSDFSDYTKRARKARHLRLPAHGGGCRRGC